jgi:cyclopropane-fatty-acyl-phospholipid synthase
MASEGRLKMDKIVDWMERGLIADIGVRLGIRWLLKKRLNDEMASQNGANSESIRQFVEELKTCDIAVNTSEANQQHYELPPFFFELTLGKYKKYSSCYWGDGTSQLDSAEESSLISTCERAELVDGMDILELGCGWGSLSLWMAEKYPNSKIVAISNSNPQREAISKIAKDRGLNNLTVLTKDINQFSIDKKFDRVVSIEMFEHMRNYERLMENIASWLKPSGKLFVHIFCHCEYAYFFETAGSDNWMGRYFFSGGVMPSEDLLSNFQKDLSLEKQWRWNGRHYMKTSNAWLKNMDEKKSVILPIFKEVYGEKESSIWFQRWRIFFMACAELFGYKRGKEWIVAHYLFRKN